MASVPGGAKQGERGTRWSRCGGDSWVKITALAVVIARFAETCKCSVTFRGVWVTRLRGLMFVVRVHIGHRCDLLLSYIVEYCLSVRDCPNTHTAWMINLRVDSKSNYKTQAANPINTKPNVYKGLFNSQQRVCR